MTFILGHILRSHLSLPPSFFDSRKARGQPLLSIIDINPSCLLGHILLGPVRHSMFDHTRRPPSWPFSVRIHPRFLTCILLLHTFSSPSFQAFQASGLFASPVRTFCRGRVFFLFNFRQRIFFRIHFCHSVVLSFIHSTASERHSIPSHPCPVLSLSLLAHVPRVIINFCSKPCLEHSCFWTDIIYDADIVRSANFVLIYLSVFGIFWPAFSVSACDAGGSCTHVRKALHCAQTVSLFFVLLFFRGAVPVSTASRS